jgi:hypothetical protein
MSREPPDRKTKAAMVLFDKETQRIAERMYKAFASANPPGPEHDYLGLARQIGRELFVKCKDRPGDTVDYFIFGLLAAQQEWEDAQPPDPDSSDYDKAVAAQRREARKTLLRVVTIDGKPVVEEH